MYSLQRLFILKKHREENLFMIKVFFTSLEVIAVRGGGSILKKKQSIFLHS